MLEAVVTRGPRAEGSRRSLVYFLTGLTCLRIVLGPGDQPHAAAPPQARSDKCSARCEEPGQGWRRANGEGWEMLIRNTNRTRGLRMRQAVHFVRLPYTRRRRAKAPTSAQRAQELAEGQAGTWKRA
jgi:hypothetical protein